MRAKNTPLLCQIFLKPKGKVCLGRKLKTKKESLVGHTLGVQVPPLTGCRLGPTVRKYLLGNLIQIICP